jgi:hypothetical protein
MPSVMDAPESIEYVETHDLTIETIERPPVRRTHPGFWRTLAHGISTYLSPIRHERSASSCRVSRPFEPSMDRFTRDYPSLALYALAMI